MATPDLIGKKARAFLSDGSTHKTGTVIAYCNAPQVLIETENGEQIWWREDLTEIGENNPRAEKSQWR